MIEVIRLSQKAKDQLVWLKRQTGITQWNVLCRWALCISISDPTPIGDFDDTVDSNLEIRWDVFAGEHKEIYHAVIVMLCRSNENQCSSKSMTRTTRQHIHRGISRLVGATKITSVSDLHRLTET